MVGAVLSESTELVVKSQPNPQSAIKTCTSFFWSSRCHLLLLLPHLLQLSSQSQWPVLIPGQLPCLCFHESGNISYRQINSAEGKTS